ncbi:hypothetical protein [Flavobacterium chungnamense]
MEEFEEFDNGTIKTDSVKKNIAGLIDAIVIIIFYCISYFLNISYFINLIDTFKILYIFAIFLIYRLVSIIIIKRTLGMTLVGIEFSKGDRTELNLKEKLLTIIMVYINGVDCFNKK